ncbi:MAG: hypothetical protein K8S23_12085 [Candidatus Cloacimonetes bacterium]|nr:hypothetical protein [Candidatus Cloacimonadota bacterium]
MAKKKKNLSPKYQVWIDARKKFKLSHAHIQMARELGLNPKKFGSLANSSQEPWKLPLPAFIEKIYFKRFKREKPEIVRSIEQMVKDKKKKQSERKEKKRLENKSKSLED